MAQIIQGPWKPFPIHSVTQEPSGDWQCTIIKLRPRKRAPAEASLQTKASTGAGDAPAVKPAS